MGNNIKNIKSFNENDAHKLKEFVDKTEKKVLNMGFRALTDDFCKINLEKIISCLKNLNKNEYQTEKTKQLMRLTPSITFAIQTYYSSNEATEWILSLKLHETFKEMLTFFANPSGGIQYKDRKYMIARILQSLLNITKDDEIAIENLNSGIIEIALQLLEKEDFLSAQQLKNKDSTDLYDVLISFLYANARITVIKPALLDMNIIDKLIKHKKKLDIALSSCVKNTEYLNLRNAYIFSAFIELMSEDQLENLKIIHDIVAGLLDIINKTIKQSTNNINAVYSKFYFTYNTGSSKKYVFVSHFLNCLLAISVNDRIKEIIFQMGGLDSIFTILKEDENEFDQRTTAELILSLCFNENVKAHIKQNEEVMKLIAYKAVNSKTQELVNMYKQIIEMVNGRLEKHFLSAETNSNKSDNSHVLMSYCHKNKENCVKLNDILKTRGYKTWFEDEYRSRNMLQDMAEAVENASIVIICYSEDYKMSPYCRLEAEYSIKCSKPIISVKVGSNYKVDGWLKEYLGVRTAYDFSNSELNETDSLIDHITLIRNGITNEGDSAPLYEDIHKSEIEKYEIKKSAIEKWTTVEVKNWLINYRLNDWLAFFKDFDGLSLLGLHGLKKSNCSYFCETIDVEITKHNYEISLPARLKLFQLLDSISVK